MLDAIPQLLGVADVLEGDRTDALGIHALELQWHAERNRGEDGQLVRRVDALDIERRIGLRVAELLRLGQHVGERAARVPHLGQNEVAGAVDDAGDALDAITRESLPDRLDNRNTARHRGLERDGHPSIVRGTEDLVAVKRDQGLVGGDHVLAVGDCPHHQIECGVDAADELHHDLDLGVVDHIGALVGQVDHLGGTDPGLGEVAHTGPHDVDRTTRPSRDLLAVSREHVHGSAAHGAEPEESDLDRLHRHGKPYLAHGIHATTQRGRGGSRTAKKRRVTIPNRGLECQLAAGLTRSAVCYPARSIIYPDRRIMADALDIAREQILEPRRTR